MGKVKVLLIGAAFSADLHAEGYSRCTDIAEIVAICDKDLSRVKTLADRYGFKDYAVYDDMFKAIDEVECDVVDICLPNFLHVEAAKRAFAKGRHVVSEKQRCQSFFELIENEQHTLRFFITFVSKRLYFDLVNRRKRAFGGSKIRASQNTNKKDNP